MPLHAHKPVFTRPDGQRLTTLKRGDVVRVNNWRIVTVHGCEVYEDKVIVFGCAKESGNIVWVDTRDIQTVVKFVDEHETLDNLIREIVESLEY